MSDNFPDKTIKRTYLLRCLDLQVIQTVQAIQGTGSHVGSVSKEIKQRRWHDVTVALTFVTEAAETARAAKEGPKHHLHNEGKILLLQND